MLINNVLNKEIVSELEMLINKIKDRIEVHKIILFGSYASGCPTKKSDIDLCVITSDNRRKIEILWDLQNVIYETTKHPVDIIVSKADEFNDRVNSVSTIEKNIAKNGVVLYG